MLSFFVEHVHEDTPNVANWAVIQSLANKKNDPAADDLIAKYVLEAQRIKMDLPIVRQYLPADNATPYSVSAVKTAGKDGKPDETETKVIVPRQHVVLHVVSRTLRKLFMHFRSN